VFFKAFALYLSVILHAAADDQILGAQQWLERMNHAIKTLNYQGTVIFMKNGQLETMKYRHTVENGIELERLSSLNSPLREVTRKSNEVSCLFKETGQKIINHHPIDNSFIINLPADLADIKQSYSITAVAKELIARLPTQIINIQPLDQLRYPRKIWIETQHFLPLKTETYNLDGATLEQVVFTDLQVNGANESDNSEIDDKKLQIKHIHESQVEPVDTAPFRLKNWPAGFKSVFFIRNSLQQLQNAVDHLMISDGFSSVSIYMEPKAEKVEQGLRSLGSVNSFSRVIDNYQITVLGEVPAKTVEFIANGIILR